MVYNDIGFKDVGIRKSNTILGQNISKCDNIEKTTLYNRYRIEPAYLTYE